MGGICSSCESTGTNTITVPNNWNATNIRDIKDKDLSPKNVQKSLNSFDSTHGGSSYISKTDELTTDHNIIIPRRASHSIASSTTTGAPVTQTLTDNRKLFDENKNSFSFRRKSAFVRKQSKIAPEENAIDLTTISGNSSTLFF